MMRPSGVLGKLHNIRVMFHVEILLHRLRDRLVSCDFEGISRIFVELRVAAELCEASIPLCWQVEQHQ